MIRSINIFKSQDKTFPIRVEFWEDNKLVDIYEVFQILPVLNQRMVEFISLEIE